MLQNNNSGMEENGLVVIEQTSFQNEKFYFYEPFSGEEEKVGECVCKKKKKLTLH